MSKLNAEDEYNADILEEAKRIRAEKPGQVSRWLRSAGVFLINVLFATSRVFCYVGKHRYQRTNRTSLPERCCVRCNQHQIRVGINDDKWINIRKNL